MKNSKFQIETVGISPVQCTAKTDLLKPQEVMAAAPRHLRDHSATGNVPPIDVPVRILRSDVQLCHSSFELANAHYAAEAGGIDSPSRQAIVEQTPILAESIGLVSAQIKTQPAVSLGQKSRAKAPTQK